MNIRHSIAAALLAIALVLPVQFAIAQGVEKLDINAATAEQLTAVPGLNASLAIGIIEYRVDMGEIQDLDELFDLPGMSLELLTQLRAYLGVGYIVCSLPVQD